MILCIVELQEMFQLVSMNINQEQEQNTLAHINLKKIVYVDIFEDKSSASKEEYRIKKTLTRQEKLALIEQNQKRTKEILTQLSEN